jgi:hypothetical protein
MSTTLAAQSLLVLLLFSAPLVAQTTSPATRAPGRPLARRVAELEADFYQRFPLARAVEQRHAHLRTSYETDTLDSRYKVRNYFTTLGDRATEAHGMYSLLRSQWSAVTFTQRLKQPLMADVLKALLFSSAESRQRHIDQLRAANPALREADLATPDALVEAMKAAADRAAAENQARFDATAKRLNFPDWVVAQAKVDAEIQGEIELLATYLVAITPRDLLAARRDLAAENSAPPPSRPAHNFP